MRERKGNIWKGREKEGKRKKKREKAIKIVKDSIPYNGIIS